jgi:hypothetical protein
MRSVTAGLDLIEEHNFPDTLNETTVCRVEQHATGPLRIVLKAIDLDRDPRVIAGTPTRSKRAPEDQQRIDSSIGRTKSSIRTRCLAFAVDRLLTLTYRENQQDRETAYQHTVEFVDRARKAGVLVDYIAVPERQKRGAWHIHLAVRGYLPVLTIRRIWRDVIGPLGGNIDISYHRGKPRTPWRIAGYIAKYIGKAVAECPPGQRTFWASPLRSRAPLKWTFIADGATALTQLLAAILPVLEDYRASMGLGPLDIWHPRPTEGRPPGNPPVVVIHCA